MDDVLEVAIRPPGPPLEVFLKKLTIKTINTLDVVEMKMQMALFTVLEMILNCLIITVFTVRRITSPGDNTYMYKTARVDMLSFLWVGFWSLVVVLFFVPPDLKLNVMIRAFRYVVGTFQTSGLCFVLFSMLYMFKRSSDADARAAVVN